jgi:phosphate transport system permease protein
MENLLFGGNFQQWLYAKFGVTYETRNSLVVGFALGFAVIPIIFTVSEDALSNVPKSLSSAALALGASRWQTVRKIVIPAASGGIFAAIMLGLGRAVGETMIVLMATGNTPIIDWSPFNGFRAMSANIAVEIPEAPVGGTLYRVLFLTALLLFAFTFVLNTLSSLIGDRLRKKYARF